MSLPLFQLPQSSIVYFNSLYLFSFPFSFSTLGVKETGWVSDLVLNYSTQLSYQDNFLSLCSSKSHKILQPSDYSISPVFVHTLCQLFQIPIFQSLQWVILATLHSFCPNLGCTDTLCATVSSFTSHNLHIWDTSSPDVLLYLLLVFNVLSCTSVIMFSVSFLRNCFFNSPMLHLLLPGKFLFRIACVKLYFITYFHVSFKCFLFLELFFFFFLDYQNTSHSTIFLQLTWNIFQSFFPPFSYESTTPYASLNKQSVYVSLRMVWPIHAKHFPGLFIEWLEILYCPFYYPCTVSYY